MTLIIFFKYVSIVKSELKWLLHIINIIYSIVAASLAEDKSCLPRFERKR